MIDAPNKKRIPIATNIVPKHVHPLNSPAVWQMSPAYAAPPDVDVVHWQREIDSIIGQTRGNESIIKLVWNGDRRFWREYFMRWDTGGKPAERPAMRPIVRYKALRKPTREFVRDVFPPRWLLLARIEPEQFADSWRAGSFVWAPEINNFKQIRPEDPPPVLWLWFQTVGEHNGYCCADAEKKRERCYGNYAPPEACLAALREHRRLTDLNKTSHDPFAKLSPAFIRACEEEYTGYREELRKLEVESKIFLENPMALVGLLPQLEEGVSESKARIIVKSHFDRELDETSKLIN